MSVFLVASAPAFAGGSRDAAAGGSSSLAENFRTPPMSARPRVIWPWMNGNVTKDGIRRDLEWMRRIGVAGVETADAAIDTPQVVPHRLAYMSPGWQDAFRSAAELTDRYGMELSIGASPGWSMTGGPWVAPDQAMKKLVWSTTEVEGGKLFHGRLAMPPANVGPFRNLPVMGDQQPTAKTAALRFYRDDIVVAYREPVREPVPEAVTSNGGRLDAAALADGDLTNGTILKPAAKDGEVWICAHYRKPVTIQGLTLGMIADMRLGYRAAVEASQDGKNWRQVAVFPPAAQLQRMQMGEQTISFTPVTARHFRLILSPAAPLPASLRPAAAAAPGTIAAGGSGGVAPERQYRISELVFRAGATVHEFEKKAMFAAPPRDFYRLAGTPAFATGSAVDPARVVVLTGRMKPDGTLDWTPPAGRWIVLRMGYSLTGTENHPAAIEATGLEADKLDAADVRTYIEAYLDTYEKITGPKLFGQHGLSALDIASSEIGQQNWTPKILAEFKRRRGYDPVPWLPALTGVAVQSPAASDKFLWDFRETVNELFAENHYGTIADVARMRGLKSRGEALEDHRPTFGDDMDMRRYFDVPMGALWTYDTTRFPASLTYEADILGAASVAHVYGQNLVAAESLTSDRQPWASGPRDLKPYIDMEFVRGTNLVYLHTSVHQPTEQAPGLSLFGYGQFFTRHESWAEDAGPWINYIARCSYMLQQGHFAADVAYFYGEEAPITSIWGNKRVTDVPEGYAYDFFNRNALSELSVADGTLATKSGMRYRVLYLGGSSAKMTLFVLRRLHALAKAGAVIVGRRPADSPSLADDPAAFDAEADALFGPAGADGVHAVGKGRVFASGSLAEAFAALRLTPDFVYTKPEADSELLYIHRRLAKGDLYFVSNRRNRAERVTARFRVAGFAPEIWNPVSGERAPADAAAAAGETAVTLDLPAYGSAFVVFRKPGVPQAAKVPVMKPVQTLRGPWQVAFQKDRGAPAAITLKTLQSWSDSADPGVKYFSGRAAYRKSFVLTAKAFAPDTKLFLDLGDVREIAEVTLNGKSVGSVWTTPYRLDITKYAKPGKNVLKVTIVNLWVNRLIGDAQPNVERKYTFSIIPTYRADAPLRPSGLIGPIRVMVTSATD